MIATSLLAQLLTLALDTWGRIQARRNARQQLTQAEQLRAALTQTDANTQLYEQIVREAQAQMAAHSTQLAQNFAQLDQLVEQLKAAARE